MASNGVSSATQTITVAVDAGTPVAGTVTVGNPNQVTGVVTGSSGFSDPAGRPLAYTFPATSAGGGTITVAGNGAYTYTPAQSQRQEATAATTDTFTVTAGNGVHSTTRTVTVAVGAGTPQAGALTTSVPAVATGVITGSARYSDPAGRTLTYSAPARSAGGGAVSVDTATGAFIYTPTQAQRQASTGTTTDTFTLTANNGVNSATRTVSVSVDPGTPVVGVATKGAASPGTGAITGSAVFTDSAGRTLTYAGPITSKGGATVSVDANSGAFIYTPTATQRRAATTSTTDTFTVTGNNGVRTTTQTITVNVRPAVPVAGTLTTGSPVPSTGAISGTSPFTDSTGASLNNLTYSAPTSSTGGGTVSVNRTTGAFTYTPAIAQRRAATGSTTDTFTVSATNGIDTVSRVVTVAVDVGTPVAGSFTAGKPNQISGVVSGASGFSDRVGRTLTYSAPVNSAGGGTVSVNAATGAFTYTPTQSQRQQATAGTTDSFTVTASNGLTSTTRTVTVAVGAGTPQVGATLSRPTFTDPYTGTYSGSAAANFTDPAGRTMTYSVPGTSVGGGTVTLNPTTGMFTYTPTAAQRRAATSATTDSFTVTANNGVNSANLTFVIGVDPGTPVAGVATQTAEDPTTGSVQGSPIFTDTAGRTLAYSGSTASSGGGTVTVDSTTGAFVYTPSATQRRTATAGTTDTFTIKAFNGVRMGYQTVVVAVDPGTPVAGDATVGAPSADTGIATGAVSFTDSAGRTLSYSTPGTSTGGGAVTVDPTTGAFSYTPTQVQRQGADGTTTDTFTVIADNGIRTASQTFTVVVDPGTPVAGDATVGTPSSDTGIATGTASFTDTAGRSLTYSTGGTSDGGGSVSIDAQTGAFTYTPAQAQRQASDGTTTDTFTVTAGNGVRTTSQVVTVVVDPGTPVAGDATVGTPSNATGEVSGTAAFTDTAERTLSYSTPGASDGGGTVSIDSQSGAFVYTPTQAQRQAATGSTTDTFRITASNGVNTATTTVTVAVNAGTPVAGTAVVGSPDTSAPVLGTFSNKTKANGLGDNLVYGVYASGSTVYAATFTGLAISTDGGASFTNRTFANSGVGSGGANGNQIKGVYVSGGTIYTAGFNGGVSISTDGGTSFTTKTTADGLGSNAVNGVYVSGGTIYAATSAGLSISTDGGTSFTTKTATSNALANNSVNAVYVDGGTIYAATGSGLSISTDGGAHFVTKSLAAGISGLNVRSVYASGSTVYAGTPQALNISSDGGTNFVNKKTVDGLSGNSVGGVYGSGGTIYAVTGGGLSISTDGGAHFTNYTLTTGGTGNGVYVSGRTVYAATGGGLSIAAYTGGDGAVTGSAAFTDPAGRTLSYSAPATSTGGGTISINAATGAYTYTPTAAQRAAATGSTTDTFVITASNGINTTTQTVTVSVA